MTAQLEVFLRGVRPVVRLPLEVRRLRIDGDVSPGMVEAACFVLGQAPRRLCVNGGDYLRARDSIKFADINVVLDEALPLDAWRLEGDTRCVYSPGA